MTRAKIGRLISCMLAIFCLWSFVFLLIVPVISWIKFSSWEERPVSLEHAEIIKTGPGSKDRRLLVDFRYSWQGEDYQGSGTTIFHPLQGMPARYQHELLTQFTQQAEQQSLRAFINSDDPSESTLTRGFLFDWYMRNVYLLVLTVYWTFGAHWVVKLATSADEPTENTKLAKDEQDAESAWKFVMYFAGMFLLLSIAIISTIIDRVGDGDRGVLAFLIFPAASLCLWWLTWAARSGRIKPKTTAID